MPGAFLAFAPLPLPLSPPPSTIGAPAPTQIPGAPPSYDFSLRYPPPLPSSCEQQSWRSLADFGDHVPTSGVLEIAGTPSPGQNGTTATQNGKGKERMKTETNFLETVWETAPVVMQAGPRLVSVKEVMVDGGCVVM